MAKRNPGDIYVEWSVNEKAALEVAAGGAYAGLRTMVTMKQVGLNVASDPLMSLAYIGIEGGMVVVVAGDRAPFPLKPSRIPGNSLPSASCPFSIPLRRRNATA